MITLIMVLFVILCIALTIAILIQQGKGDMGLGSLGGGSQTLFGGSGGQDFFEKLTWVMGALFVFGALGITILKTKSVDASRLKYLKTLSQAPQKKAPANPQIPKDANNIPQPK